MGGFILSPQKILLKLEERQDLVRYGTSKPKDNTIFPVPLIIKPYILIISLKEKQVIRFM